MDESYYYYNAINKIKHNSWTINPSQGENFNERFLTSFFYIYINYLIGKILGISLFSFRLLTYFLSILLSILFYIFLRYHLDKKSALLSILLLCSTNTFLSISRIVRPEILMLVFLCSCLLLIQKNKFCYSGFLFGICLFFVKFNSFIFTFIFALYVAAFQLKEEYNVKYIIKSLLHFLLGILPIAILYAFFVNKYLTLFKALTPVILFENNFSIFNFFKESFFLWTSTIFSLDPFLYSYAIAVVPILVLEKNTLIKISSLSVAIIIGINLFFRLGHEIIRNVFILPFCLIICHHFLFKMNKDEWLNAIEKLKEYLSQKFFYKILSILITIYIIFSWYLLNYFSLNYLISNKLLAIAISFIAVMTYLYLFYQQHHPMTLYIYLQTFVITFPFGNALNWIISLLIPAEYYNTKMIRYCSYTTAFIISLIFIPLIAKFLCNLNIIRWVLVIGLIASTIIGLTAQFMYKEYTMLDYVNSASSVIKDGSVVYGVPAAILLLGKDIYALRTSFKESTYSYVAIQSPKDFPYPFEMNKYKNKYKLLLKKELVCFGIDKKCLMDIYLFRIYSGFFKNKVK